MAKLIAVAGLPGCGKSHHVSELRKHCTGVCAEDFQAFAHNNSPRFTDSKHYADLIRDLRDGKDCVIADIAYCDTWLRVEVEEAVRRDVLGVEIEWHYFENDPGQCLANVVKRARGNDVKTQMQMVYEFSRKYCIPQGAIVVPVWRPVSATSA
jgi:hypothetical protein